MRTSIKLLTALVMTTSLLGLTACGPETVPVEEVDATSGPTGGKGDAPQDGACSLAEDEERAVSSFEKDGQTQQRCRGNDGRFVEDACCPELASDAGLTDDELECVCFEQSYNECLLGVTDGDFEPCTKMIDDTLLDDNCCDNHGDLVSVLCNFEPDEDTGSEQLDRALAPLCVAEPAENNTTANNSTPVDPVAEERRECACFEQSYNECLLGVTDGDFEPCTKMIDDTLLDDDCCENHGDLVSVLCNFEPDEDTAVEDIDSLHGEDACTL